MHFITGGAYNGKRAWVKRIYQAEKKENWLSAYSHQSLPDEITEAHNDLLILEGIEIWLKSLLEKYEINQAREVWNCCLKDWLQWEKDRESRKLVIIGSDLTKGIVPLEKESRLWRDLSGWAFQDTAMKAEKIDVIWYGINQSIK